MQLHSDLFSEMMDGETSVLERINTDISDLSDLEGDAELFNAVREAEASLSSGAARGELGWLASNTVV